MHDIDRAMFEVAEQGYETESFPGEVFETYEMHEAMYGAHEREEASELELALHCVGHLLGGRSSSGAS